MVTHFRSPRFALPHFPLALQAIIPYSTPLLWSFADYGNQDTIYIVIND